MRKNILFLIFIFCSIFFATYASAMTPSLSLSATGTGDEVQINVTGDSNASVLLFYTNSAFAFLGTTNSSGNFSTIVNSSTNSITINTQVYVKVGGVAGTQSNTVSWPYVQASSNNSTTTLTLSQTALLLNAGQTSVLTAGASYLYLSSNTNPAIANINLNANKVTVTANAYGSTIAKICVVGSTTNCVNLNVTVQNAGTQQLTFSQNNFSLYSGQSTTVNVSGGSGSYIISNNSNTNAIQAGINGSVINLSATGTSGASSITVCTSNMNYCGILNVNSTSVNSTAVTFSQTNPFVSLNQNSTVTIYGGAGTNFYVSSNSNPSVVQANIVGNILTLIGNSIGSSTINICAYAGSCASLTANVGNIGSSDGLIVLSQSSISILAGQVSNITISGGSAPYTISSQNSTNIFNSNISGNILTIYGVNPGSATASVCSSTGCVNLSVIVGNTNSTTNLSLSQNNISLNIGQQSTIFVSGNGGYYIANNSSPNVASVNIIGNSVVVSGNYAGSSNLSICQSGGQCANLYVTVQSSTTAQTTPVNTVVYFNLARYLGAGDKGDDVLQLQNALAKLGFLSATPNGYYGLATAAAVKAFQKNNGIRQTGNVGGLTKSALESLKISLSSTSTAQTNQMASLQAAINALMAQVRALQGQ